MSHYKDQYQSKENKSGKEEKPAKKPSVSKGGGKSGR